MPLFAVIRASVATLVLALWGLVAHAAADFLPPEQAFRFEARVVDPRTAELSFEVTEGYYLYREQFRISADSPRARLGEPQIPPGKVKFDETFQKDVETHRGRVVIRLPVEEAPAKLLLTVRSQGCADAGLCYPPMESRTELRLAAFGGDGSARVLTDGGRPEGSALARLGGGDAVAQPASASAAGSVAPAGTGAESGIEGALRSGRFWWVVGSFFVAGLLLSLTPCVLPMLPILSSIIVGSQGQTTRSRGLLLASTYSLGMALVYTALGVAAGLAGEGLAAWLQTPTVLAAFALLLALFALSMFGLYELQLPSRWRDAMSARSSRLQGGHVAGVFAMGGLSALIVSPCVAAPLAGALVYLSQTRDVVLGGSALFSLAAGMSVPLLALGASAGALLPSAGPWMEGVKRFFGVLLLGVAWWTVSPVLPPAWGVAGWGVLLLVSASFLRAFDRLGEGHGPAHRLGQALGLALAVVGATQLVGAASGAQDPLQPLRHLQALTGGSANATPQAQLAAASSGSGTKAGAGRGSAKGFQRVASLQELDDILRLNPGRPVMLDFYADWCVSCKEMERFTFADPAIGERLSKALTLQADVTRNTPEDRALLKHFGLFGPPGIVFFDGSGREIEGVRVIGFQNAERFGQSLSAAGL
jgi:thiol:disulfide interchange protein DsbD